MSFENSNFISRAELTAEITHNSLILAKENNQKVLSNHKSQLLVNNLLPNLFKYLVL